MSVVGHNDVSEDPKTSGTPRFIQRLADYLFDLVGSKDTKPIVSDRCQVVSGRGAGDLKHIGRWWPRLLTSIAFRYSRPRSWAFVPGVRNSFAFPVRSLNSQRLRHLF